MEIVSWGIPLSISGAMGQEWAKTKSIALAWQLLVLLGSHGKVHFDPGRSDIDIALLSRKQLHQDDYLQLMGDLSAFFQYGKLDLFDLKRASGLGLQYHCLLRL